VKPFYLSSETVLPITPFYLSNATCTAYTAASRPLSTRPGDEHGGDNDGGGCGGDNDGDGSG
jgi:hypothetical protein